MSEITIGMSGEASTVVSDANTAIRAKSGALPVFATPMMVALMEEAACAALASVLPPERQSLGVHIDVTHQAPSIVGTDVTARADVTEVSGAKVQFHVEAHDEAGLIGKGSHTRVVVDAAKFMAKAQSRRNG